jgi:MFS family permease
MLSLAILLHVQASLGSYALAGAVVACMSIGEAMAVPLASRLVGVFGIRPTLVTAAAINAAGLLALASLSADAWVLLVLGLLIGASVPPVMPVIRAVYPRLVPRSVVSALFALDTTAQELIWICGPVVATVLATTVSTPAPLYIASAVTMIGTAWFVSTPRLSEVRIERSSSRFGRVLVSRSIGLAMVASFALVASFMALEIGVVAQFEGEGVLAGAMIAVSARGSLVGGIAFGHRHFSVRVLVAALGVVAIGTGLASIVPGVALQSAALFVSGLGFAPALAALYYMVSKVVDERAAAEAFGWLNTAALVGGAAGTAVAGVMGDVWGPAGAYAAATVLAVAAAASPAVIRLSGPIRGMSD